MGGSKPRVIIRGGAEGKPSNDGTMSYYYYTDVYDRKFDKKFDKVRPYMVMYQQPDTQLADLTLGRPRARCQVRRGDSSSFLQKWGQGMEPEHHRFD
jgi:hypothetical protein